MNNADKTIVEKSKEFFYKAYMFQMKGNYNEAIKNYKISIDFYPTPEAFTYLGWAYSYLGDYERAIEECKNAIDVDPEFGNPYNDIGAYLIKQGKFDEAITWLELALKARRYDHYEFAHVNLGVALEQKGLWLEALDEYRTAIDVAPEYVAAKQNYHRLQGMLN
jgi:tetratricopeptide (TPR) repeat protein